MGPQYASAIFYTDDEQVRALSASSAVASSAVASSAVASSAVVIPPLHTHTLLHTLSTHTQLATAKEVMAESQKLWPAPIVTKLLPLAADGAAKFWDAEVRFCVCTWVFFCQLRAQLSTSSSHIINIHGRLRHARL